MTAVVNYTKLFSFFYKHLYCLLLTNSQELIGDFALTGCCPGPDGDFRPGAQGFHMSINVHMNAERETYYIQY